MTLQEIEKKIHQQECGRKYVHLQLFTAVRKNDLQRVESRARALVETIEEINRLKDLKNRFEQPST